jgi:hypothetical protein
MWKVCTAWLLLPGNFARLLSFHARSRVLPHRVFEGRIVMPDELERLHKQLVHQRPPKKAAWLMLSPCAQPGFNPLPTGSIRRGLPH